MRHDINRSFHWLTQNRKPIEKIVTGVAKQPNHKEDTEVIVTRGHFISLFNLLSV